MSGFGSRYCVYFGRQRITTTPLCLWHTKTFYREVWQYDDTQHIMGARTVKSLLDAYVYCTHLLLSRSTYYVIKVDGEIAGYFRVQNTNTFYEIGYVLTPKFYGKQILDIVFNNWIATHRDKHCLAVVRRCNVHSQNFLRRFDFQPSPMELSNDCVCFVRA